MKKRRIKLTEELIKQHFGNDADVTGWGWGDYMVRTADGGVILISEDGFKTKKPSPAIAYGTASLGKVLWGSVRVAGDKSFVLQTVMAGQAVGVDVEAGPTKRCFGLWTEPPPMIPRPSGMYGNAKIATDRDIWNGGLTQTKAGEGLRLGEDSEGRVIRYAGPNCIFVIGPPGAGKQAAFATPLIVEARNTSLTLLDPKVELLPITGAARQSIGPTRWIVPYKEGLPEECAHYADTTDSYDPGILLDPQAESFVANLRTLSQILIASEGEMKDSGFFTGNAQMGSAGLLGYIRECHPDQSCLPELARIVCSNDIFSVARTAVDTASAPVRDRLSIFAAPDAPMLKGGLGDILRTMREQLEWLSDPAIARILQKPVKPWRFDDLKRGPKPSTVYIGVAPKFVDTSHRLFRLLLGCQFIELQSTPPGRWPVACIADEFAMLGKVPIFSTVFAEGRGHGFKVVAMVQNVGQMITAYGREGFRNFLSGSGVQVWFPPRDYESAEELARWAGRKTVLTMNQSHSGRQGRDDANFSFSEAGVDVLTPQQVMGLGDDKLILIAPGLVKDVIIARRRNYRDVPEIARLCGDNPYHRKREAKRGTNDGDEKLLDMIKRIAREGPRGRP